VQIAVQLYDPNAGRDAALAPRSQYDSRSQALQPIVPLLNTTKT
jgi:hypothetical protein